MLDKTAIVKVVVPGTSGLRIDTMRQIVITLAACLIVACAPATDQTELQLGAATLGGAYFPIGQGISNLVTEHAADLTMVPIVTRGAVENPRLVSLGDVEIGMTNADLAYFAFNGETPYDEPQSIMGAGALHPSVLHLVTLADANLNSIPDLRGRRVALGPAGGTTFAYANLMLEAYDMTLDDIVPSFLSYSDGFSQLGDGNVDAAFMLAGVPAAAVLQTRATQELSFITIGQDVFDEIIRENPYYYTVTIMSDVYDLDQDYEVLAVDNMLVVSADQSPDTVFSIVEAVYGNLDQFRSTNAIAQQINPEQSLRSPIPLHPGAARYCEQF